MITYKTGSILTDIQDYSVIIHQCNAKGWMGAGLAKEIAKRWPKAFEEYHHYCRAFSDGHEKEIMGTFARTFVSPKLIICNAIAQLTVGRAQQQTDYSSWEKLCCKLERQTRYVNKKMGLNWTLHMPEKIGCGLGGGDPDEMHQIFERYFADSPVELVLHKC